MPRLNRPPKVRFRLRSANDKFYIVAFFAIRNGVRYQFATGYDIQPSEWSKETQRVKPQKFKGGAEINTMLSRIEIEFDELYKQHGSAGTFEQYRQGFMKCRGIDAGAGTNDEKQVQAGRVTFKDYIDTFVTNKRSAKKTKTWRSYSARLNTVLKFAEERRKKIDWDTIDEQFLIEFRQWLYSEPRCYNMNQVQAIISKLKELMNDAKRRGHHNNSSYMNFKTKGSEVTKFALSFEELEHLYTLNFGPDTALELVRDIFLVGCYTGLRISDYGRIKPEHIKETDGQHLLTISQQKTGSDVVIPLLPIALSILKKYDFHIPDLPSLTMNNGLKKLGQAAGYNSELRVIQSNGGQIKEVTVPKWKKITSHVARRSFATNFYRAGIPIAIIMKITGHKSEAMFMKYIAIDATENALKFAELAKGIKP